MLNTSFNGKPAVRRIGESRGVAADLPSKSFMQSNADSPPPARTGRRIDQIGRIPRIFERFGFWPALRRQPPSVERQR
jgi:hypothetical protein